ncbi:MAG: nitrogenase iron-molybdenum cofactor biosynthesis protein NifN, partial [Cyanobacteria bacterium J06554_3]
SSKKSTEEDKARIKKLLGADGIMMAQGNAKKLLKVIAATNADMLIAGGRNQYTALKARIPFLDINQERHHPYAGYVGMIEMAKELDGALHSPIWEQVRSPAPWQSSPTHSDLIPGPTLRLGERLKREPPSKVVARRKSVAVNPLKQSQPLGAALAYLGIKGMMPLLHGSQGCTAFAKVMLVRHFREAIPLSTTAMSEVTTILGGEENIETALMTLIEKSDPAIVGLCTTGLTETRGDDMPRILKELRESNPQLAQLPIACATTPDFKGALQDGYAAAVEAIVRDIPNTGPDSDRQTDATGDPFYSYAAPGLPSQITVLAGPSLAPGDVQAIKDMVKAFSLNPVVLPDLSTSLDGHLADRSYSGNTSGGTPLSHIKALSASAFTLAVGESMKLSAEILQQRFGTEFKCFNDLIGLDSVDGFLQTLCDISSRPVPEKFSHQRRQLQDAMLDAHFFFGRKRVALALEPDLLHNIAWWLASMGAEVHAAVTTTKSKLLKDLPIDTVTIGDLEDFEALAQGADLLIASSSVKPLSERLGIPLYRLGFPVFDRLGNGHRCSVGYDGTTRLLFDIGNLFLEADEIHAQAQVHTWREGL